MKGMSVRVQFKRSVSSFVWEWYEAVTSYWGEQEFRISSIT